MQLSPGWRRHAPAVAFVAGLLAQIALIVVGLAALILPDDTALDQLEWLANWCGLGTVYLVVALIALGRSSRRPPRDAPPSRFEVGRLPRIVSTTATVLASLIGVTGAVQVLAGRGGELGIVASVLGVWTMLLAWGFLHWGFAQIYYQRNFSADTPQLQFPGTEHPRLVDFVYFAFTTGTTFAASDVSVLTSRMRWTVTWHSVLSFFFNGLIIVLALNTIMGAR